MQIPKGKENTNQDVRTIKVLFVVHNFIQNWNAGVENYTYSLAKALNASGVETAILYPKYEENSSPQLIADEYNGVKNYRLITNESAQLLTEINAHRYNDIFENFLVEEEFDVVHFHHFYGLPLSFAEIVKKLNIKLFIMLHDFWLICPRLHLFINEKRKLCDVKPDPLSCAKCLAGENNSSQMPILAEILSEREQKVKEILNSADFISAPSNFVGGRFLFLGSFKPIVTIPLGLNPVNASKKQRENEIVFGYIGSIAPIKNVIFMIKAFKKAAKNQRLLIFGNGDPEEIIRVKKEISITPNISYQGSYSPDKLEEVFSEFDVLIVPSFMETYSFTVREALMANLFVLASNVGGIPDIIANEKNGLLFSPFDSEDLEGAIKRVINNPEIISKSFHNKTVVKTIAEDVDIWKTLYFNDKKFPKVSIIIPVFNKVELTQECLTSVFENTVYPNYEIIIVDNASSDGTKNFLDKIKRKHYNVKVIYNKENLGFAKANNVASEIAEGKYLHFLNNDTKVQKYWLSALVEVAENDKNVFAVGSKLLFPDRTIQHAGVAVFETRTEIAPIHLLYQYPQNTGLVLKSRLFQVLTGASLLVRKDKFFDVQKFDEDFWNGYEDVDLCFKLGELGGKLVYEPRSLVIHYESQSGPERFKATDKNISLLNKKWSGKIIQDIQKKDLGANRKNYSTINEYYPDKIKSNNSASVIIVTYNSEKTIGNCLDSVLRTIRRNDEIIIVDNASSDKTVLVLKKYEKSDLRIKVIINDRNYGFSKGCNIGIKKSVNPFIVLLNPDTTVYGNWLDKLIVHFNNPLVGAVGPLSDYVAGLQQVKLYLQGDYNYEEITSKLEKLFPAGEVATSLLIGFCLVLKRSVLNRIGLLDESLFLGNDDLELSWRLRMFGYKLVIAVDVFIAHKGQQSFKSLEKKKQSELVQASSIALYNKLKVYYGENNVPTPLNLWGVNWFNPENAKFNIESKLLNVKSKYRSLFNIIRKDIFVSIIVPVFNQFDYTRKFLTSIGESIPFSVEIIIIDNNSDDKTERFLFSYQQLTDNVTLIRNKENLGFPKAINQGFRQAKGKYIIVANNDIVFTDNWLLKMISHAEAEKTVGIVGPVSNKVSGVQLVKDAEYDSLEEMHQYARSVEERFKGQRFEFPRVAFLCTLIKREVIEKIGGLDERFSPGNYEDDDYCLRAQLAGFKTVIALDVFIHHFGSKSFKADGENKYGKLLEINKQKFIGKWGATPDDIWLKGKKPNSRELFIPLTPLSFINLVTLANEALNSENFEDALKYFEKAIEQFDETIGVKINDLLMLASKIAKLLNRYEIAEKYLLKLSESVESNAEVYNMLGEIAESKDEFQQAVGYYQKSIEIADNSELRRKIDKLKNNLLTKS